MPVTMRHYSGEKLYTNPDYIKIRDFLISLNKNKLQSPNFPWGRWEWMIGHGCLNDKYLDRILIWEEDGSIVALATYESELGDGFLCVDERHAYLKPDMLKEARLSLHSDGKFRVMINDNDWSFQHNARTMGYIPPQDKEQIAAIDINERLQYNLPEGFSIVSMADDWKWDQYHRCLWRGFNHSGEPDFSQESIGIRRRMLSGPTVYPYSVVCVVAPNGNYVSHCGTWYYPDETYALVEPVATDPDYRRLGLGKAAVLEAVIRCGKRGAKKALVGSSQQFYYSIGFSPINNETWWEYKG